VEGASYRKIFRDIVRGYSTAIFSDKQIYIKHLSPHDQVELEEIQEKYFNIALKRGVPTEEDMLEYLKSEGSWTHEDEEIISSKKAFISSLEKARTKITLKSQLDAQSKIIDREKAAVLQKELEKISLIGSTCEKYAGDRLNDFYIIKSFYKDAEFKNLLFSEDEFNEAEGEELKNIISVYNEVFSALSEENIQYTILEDFYSPYLSFAEDSMQFYGLPFCQLTYNQIRLIVYTRIFKNILDQNENIPDQVRQDPKKLLDYGSISREERDKMRDKITQGDGSTLVGASQEDYEYLGVDQGVGTVDLHEEAKKKGGTLDMDDLMKLHGVKGA
jgi:hypothetical protein